MANIPQTNDPVAWLSALGVTDAPLTRSGVAAALRFFDLRMPSLDRKMRLAFLKGMDLHKAVAETTLPVHTVLAAFRKSAEDPLKLFYTKAGTAVGQLGVNPAARSFRRFRVVQPIAALESRAGSARDTWTDESVVYVASGGGTQFIVPDAARGLELVP
jgi:hypothetical protein